jgi:protein TonB
MLCGSKPESSSIHAKQKDDFCGPVIRPMYPPLAKQARIQGTVVLDAVIGTDGYIKELRVRSGHPLLAPAAMEAVRSWKYKPYRLNGRPTEVETQVYVNFTLQ